MIKFQYLKDVVGPLSHCLEIEGKAKAQACVCSGAYFNTVYCRLLSVESKTGKDKTFLPFAVGRGPLFQVAQILPVRGVMASGYTHEVVFSWFLAIGVGL